jgi:hypothetical protein
MVRRAAKPSGMNPPRVPADDVHDADATTAFQRITVAPRSMPVRAAAAGRAVPRQLASTLLPGEHVTFGSTPHPIVLAWPLIAVLAILVAFGFAWNDLGASLHLPTIVLAGAAAAYALVSLVRNAAYFFGFRAVATNRRIFVVRGVLWRRVVPLGNGVLASSQLVQGVVGRLYGFGSIDVAQNGVRTKLFRDMREAGALYRECQAVANGVDGEHWTPAVRQTIIP